MTDYLTASLLWSMWWLVLGLVIGYALGGLQHHDGGHRNDHA